MPAAMELLTTGIAVPALGEAPKTADGAKGLYDSWAATYDNALTSWKCPVPGRVCDVLRQYGGDSSWKILDLGCGTGMSGEALAEASFGSGSRGGIVGVDISPLSLEIAERKGVYSSLKLGNLNEPHPFEKDTFDAMISASVTTYVENFDVFFRDMCRMVRPGGICVWSHIDVLWDRDFRSCATTAKALEAEGLWKLELQGEREAYMPNNPDPRENSKRIRMIVYRKTA